MSHDLPDFSPEMREIAKAVLALVEPLVRAASALDVGDDDEPGKCQQIWCPLCAAIALKTGERHPLVTSVAEHADAVLMMLRAVIDASAPGPAEPPTQDRPPSGPGRYEPIRVTVHP